MLLLYLGVIQESTKKIIYLIFSVETLQSIFDASDQTFVIKSNRTHANRITNDLSFDSLTFEIRNIPQVVIKHVQERDSDESQCHQPFLNHYREPPTEMIASGR